jgi:hypothetical protein
MLTIVKSLHQNDLLPAKPFPRRIFIVDSAQKMGLHFLSKDKMSKYKTWKDEKDIER